ncbi:PAS domain-containing protein [Vibrio vulnificus]|uniref:helix-turn-helix transcriptional regulator n=1 Tax=Vibrio vulnificus TaxID=672 RepID=UPI001CDD3EE6|nr:PAS domain-containing protein [Vibrio vulnificus]EKZ9200208.1 PAS domain-containing protein [Vibrio vulnificus]MCA3973953.1 PAS domain-containing protein [Vibrio vulnificus]
MMSVNQVRFTNEDREALKSYYRLADTIADLIGPHCEVVIHSFESLENSVVKIVNGHHTGRKIGSPITDLGLRMWSRFEKTGEVSPKSYFTNSADGSLLKSTTCVLDGPNKKPIGMLCINMNLSFPFPEIIKTLLPQCTSANSLVHENFSNNANDVIQQALASAISEIENNTSVTAKGRNKAIVRHLFENGIFELKETTTQISESLGISRQAIYKFIREFKSE